MLKRFIHSRSLAWRRELVEQIVLGLPQAIRQLLLQDLNATWSSVTGAVKRQHNRKPKTAVVPAGAPPYPAPPPLPPLSEEKADVA